MTKLAIAKALEFLQTLEDVVELRITWVTPEIGYIWKPLATSPEIVYGTDEIKKYPGASYVLNMQNKELING